MKKGLSKSTSSPEKPIRRKRKYDEEFKQQALAMVRNGQTARSVAQALGISENMIHTIDQRTYACGKRAWKR